MKDRLYQKYFVLKPEAKHSQDIYAMASQRAMDAYAECLREHDKGSILAKELTDWAAYEAVKQERMR